MELNEAIKLRDGLASIWGDVHKQFKENDEFYHGEWHCLSGEVRDKGFQEVIPVDPRRDVDTLAGHFKPDAFTVEVEPLTKGGRTPTKAAKEQATGNEELVTKMLKEVGLEKSRSSFVDMAKEAWTHGVGLLYGLWDPQKWGKEPVQKQGQSKKDYEYEAEKWEVSKALTFPFLVESVHPATVMYWPMENPTIYIQMGKVYPYDVQQSFPEYEAKQEEIFVAKDYLNIWTLEEKVYIIENKIINNNQINPFGFTPAAPVYTHLGKPNIDNDLKHRINGVIHPLKALHKEHARRITAVSIMMQAAALGRGWTRNAAPELSFTGLPGEYTEIGEAEIGHFEVPNAPQDLYNLVAMVIDDKNDFVGTKPLGGQQIPGVASALGYELLREESAKRYEAFVDSYESALARLGSQFLSIVENHLMESIPGCKQKPSGIKGYYNCSVTLVYEDVAKERMMGALSRMFYQSGLYDLKTIHGPQFLNSSDYEGIQRGLIRDRLLQDPDILKELAIMLSDQAKNKMLLEQANKRASERRKIELQPKAETKPAMDEFQRQMFEGELSPNVAGIEEGL